MKRDTNITKALFFIFGFGVMAWIPRFPELREFLHVQNGLFGTILSSGMFGSMLALLSVGQLVQHYGSRLMIIFAMALQMTCFILIVHVRDHVIFTLVNIFLGFGISSMHISINGQAFADQERGAKHLVVTAAGFWSGGALTTSLLSIFLIGRVSLRIHLMVLYIALVLITILLVNLRSETMIKPNRSSEQTLDFFATIRNFNFDWFLGFGLIFGTAMELATGDWGAIFSRDKIGISETWSPMPYIAFTVLTVVGRVSITKAQQRLPINLMIKVGGFVGGISILVAVWMARSIPFYLVCILFAIAGLGSSIIGPSFLNKANGRSPHPASVVVGQVGVINIALGWTFKQVVAWVAQYLGLSAALTIPAIMLLLVGFFARVFKPVPAK